LTFPEEAHGWALDPFTTHRDCAATDPRDFVYGLLGMSGDGQTMGIEPDYTATPQKIYSDLVLKYVNSTGSLDIICACRNQRNFNDLPSWVPDWSTDQIVPVSVSTRDTAAVTISLDHPQAK
jgi:hypothetical protein